MHTKARQGEAKNRPYSTKALYSENDYFSYKTLQAF